MFNLMNLQGKKAQQEAKVFKLLKEFLKVAVYNIPEICICMY